ncbi:MAG: Hsp20/alpha crystallin family protein [Coxiellaceae bacterium]|nr:Hsp20/alpha crystallin family protein [Coxiellaceae bacterium]
MSRMVRYEPISVLNDLNKLFERTLYPVNSSSDTSEVETGQWSPSVDIQENENDFKLLLDLPGIEKDNIHISMENNVLSIQGERLTETSNKVNGFCRTERVSGKFYRRFTLPETANEDNIKAEMSKGVLDITIGKKEVSKPKSIKIKCRD